jgi:hypothetical protein
MSKNPTIILASEKGYAEAQAVSPQLPIVVALDPRSGHVAFVVNKVAVGQVFS